MQVHAVRPAELGSTSSDCILWLAAWSDPKKGCFHPLKCLCVTWNCVFFFWTKSNIVLSWRCLNRTTVVLMLPGSGVGVLPFTFNPITPTASTNCDTGTATLLYFTFFIWHFKSSFTCTFKVSVKECAYFWVCVFSVYFLNLKHNLTQQEMTVMILEKPWSVYHFLLWNNVRINVFI